MLTFVAVSTSNLTHSGDCGFMGITPVEQLYVEEFYGDDRLAQYRLDTHGHILASVDEASSADFQPLPLPPSLIRPLSVQAALPLNHIGARYRGLREPERLMDLVQPLTLVEKIALLEQLSLKTAPMMLAGIAESRVLSEAALSSSLFLVCRRIRLAVMLPEVRLDAAGLPYDYETIVLHVAHNYDADTDTMPPLPDALTGIGGIVLNRPLECLVYRQKLYVADGGDESVHLKSRIHAWQIVEK